MIWFWLVGWAVSVYLARRYRGRFFTRFTAILLGVQVLVWWALFSEPGPLSYVAWGLSALVFAHQIHQVRPRMRGLGFRLLVSWPASFFVSGGMLALPWAVAVALGAEPHGWWIPYAIAGVGLVQSLWHRPTTRHVVLDRTPADKLRRARLPAKRRGPSKPVLDRPLRIAHLTDTHLGPFVSERRLRRVLERVVEGDPDLVLLTGDFMTVESNGDTELLKRAFAPLAELEGKVFACRGNHDHEAPQAVDQAFRALGIRLLIDEETTVETPAGDVQLVGIDYKFRDPAERVRDVSLRYPRRDGHVRVVLLHHPGHFSHIPDGLGDLVLSGHTHGGQLGLVDLGLNFTMMRLFVRYPDHGFWAEGQNRLYVNRGLGHYGFPLRAGVRAEEAMLLVHF